jgi:hypothetical protein
MKSKQSEVRKRVEEIMNLRLLGALPTDIRRHAEEAGWNVSVRQLQRYTAQADELLAQAVEKNRDKLMAHHFAARRALYARAMAVSDYATARQILKDEAELLNLYPAKKLEMGGKDGGPVELKIIEKIAGKPDPTPIGEIKEKVVSANDTNSTSNGTKAAGN